MSYPLNDELPSLMLSLGVGTLGVLVVAVTCYVSGRLDARP